MLLLTLDGWANGISATVSVIFACALGFGIIYKARKVKAKLLSYMGLNIVLAGLFWVVIAWDFFTVLLIGDNLPNPGGWMGIGHMMWAPFVILISFYIGTELMIPNKKMVKKYFLAIFLILSIIYELYVFLDPLGMFHFVQTLPSGTDLITIMTTTNSPVNILQIIFQISGLIFCGFGYLAKSFKSKGIIKKKFLLLSIGYLIYTGTPIFAVLLSRLGINILVAPYRIGLISSFLFFYYGLKEAPVKKEKKRYLKEIKVEDSLFRLYERPLQISEEEVTFHRDRKICLVCKGDVIRISYICPKCNALYCIKCSEELSNHENMCWVCNDPFDTSKPARPDKIVYKDSKDIKKKKE